MGTLLGRDAQSSSIPPSNTPLRSASVYSAVLMAQCRQQPSSGDTAADSILADSLTLLLDDERESIAPYRSQVAYLIGRLRL